VPPGPDHGDDVARFGKPIPDGGGWIWDAAHNPLPLSPAAAGLVELVDARCRIGIRQRVVGGYLFFRKSDSATPVEPESDGPRLAFDKLRAGVEPRIESLGTEPSLAAALELFVEAYQPLFGVVGPASVATRRALTDFLAQRLPDRVRDNPGLLVGLLAGVPSAATERRAAADAIMGASGVRGREVANDEYLRRFGDESPRWDVAEPTLRETPARLLLLGAGRSTSATGTATGTGTGSDLDLQAASAHASREDLGRALTPLDRRRFEDLVAAAREAVAVGEDDDALFARLQASVRRALLGLGRRLVAAGRLADVDDVFYVPLSLSRSLSQSPLDREASDLRSIALAAREAFRAAALSPPPLPRPDREASHLVRGLAGSGGRIIGRAVHHPPSAPLGADSVLIAATLLPTELPLLAPAAIVVETGEVLGHVAAQARERAIPAVVGATGARAALPDGALVIVDGDRGEVIRVESS
jgi:phosphohistidine swiveling domain-containing protein